LRTDQTFSARSTRGRCATHKDAYLTVGESPPPLGGQAALFLDVDGTLLEIVSRPELVRVPPGLPALIARLSAQREGALALISGRPLAQLDGLFNPWQGAAAGLHGLERRRVDGTLDRVLDGSAAAALDRLRPKLAALAADGGGLVLEDKGGTLALHYRAAPQRQPEVIAIAERLNREAAPLLRLIKGKMVVEFQPRSTNKGLAIAAFLAEPPFTGRQAVFVGDDATDEDGFAEIRRRAGIAVRVGPPSGATAATYRLPTVGAVLTWLARSGPS
jgi:trehalose 6-phosphate phosphatase